MFKKFTQILGRRVVRPSFLVRSHHLASLKSAAIPDSRNTHPYESPKTLQDGSVGVIHVQGHEFASLFNPMQRRFLNDLELQQNRWLKEEKKSQDDLGSLTKQVTMSLAPGKGPWSNKGGNKKKKEAEAKKKCDEMAQKEKCAKMAKKEAKEKQAEKMKQDAAKCKEMAKKEEAKKKKEAEKCKKIAGKEKDPCKKDSDKNKKDGKGGKAGKKKRKFSKKCLELAEKDKCRKLAADEARKKEMAKCKAMAEKEKCAKAAEKKKCAKLAEKEKCAKAKAEKCKKGGDKSKK